MQALGLTHFTLEFGSVPRARRVNDLVENLGVILAMNSNSEQGGGGAERRRYTRLPIHLDALVAIDGRPPVPCTVRDFCVAGVFVAISPEQLRLVRPQTSATLIFSLIVDGVQNDYQLTLTIYRIVGGGFGCGFENADAQTIQLLQSLAGDSSPVPVPDTPEEVREIFLGD